MLFYTDETRFIGPKQKKHLKSFRFLLFRVLKATTFSGGFRSRFETRNVNYDLRRRYKVKCISKPSIILSPSVVHSCEHGFGNPRGLFPVFTCFWVIPFYFIFPIQVSLDGFLFLSDTDALEYSRIEGLYFIFISSFFFWFVIRLRRQRDF